MYLPDMWLSLQNGLHTLQCILGRHSICKSHRMRQPETHTEVYWYYINLNLEVNRLNVAQWLIILPHLPMHSLNISNMGLRSASMLLINCNKLIDFIDFTSHHILDLYWIYNAWSGHYLVQTLSLFIDVLMIMNHRYHARYLLTNIYLLWSFSPV